MFSLNVALLGVRFDLTLWCLCYLVFLGALAMPIFFSSLVWHLAGMCFVQVGRLERCCCCLRGLLCDGYDTNDALCMLIILFFQDVLMASALWYAVDSTFL